MHGCWFFFFLLTFFSCRCCCFCLYRTLALDSILTMQFTLVLDIHMHVCATIVNGFNDSTVHELDPVKFLRVDEWSHSILSFRPIHCIPLRMYLFIVGEVSINFETRMWVHKNLLRVAKSMAHNNFALSQLKVSAQTGSPTLILTTPLNKKLCLITKFNAYNNNCCKAKRQSLPYFTVDSRLGDAFMRIMF